MNQISMSKTGVLIMRFLTVCTLCLVGIPMAHSSSMSGDTIPPIFITAPMNDTTNCETGNPLAAITTWYINGASAIATDNGDTVSIMATITLADAISELNNSICPTAGIVEVGFFGVDTCGNSTVDTLLASFILEDNEVPQIIDPPQNQTVVCNNLTQFLLQSWIVNLANATVEDNCSSTLEINYNWEDINGNTGQANINDPIDILVSREQCDWYVDVIFSISDGCGNVTTYSARFSIEDNDPPGFVPEIQDITLSCLDILPDPDIMAIDACDGTVDVSFTEISNQDPDSTNCGFYNYTVTRTFEAEDVCGNLASQDQVITFQDTLSPFINLLDSITLDCEVFFANELSSFLVNWGDLCSDVLVTFSQSDIDIDLCEFQVERTWTIRDRCNNITQKSQIINVTRNNPPVLTSLATDLIIPCDTSLSYNGILESWLEAAGGASSSSLCTSIEFFAAIPGSYILDNPNTFPGDVVTVFNLEECSGSDSTFAHSLAVDFVFFDNCGNASVSTAFAHVLDDIAPEFIEACPDTTIFMLMDSCNAEITLSPPRISDNCGDLESPKVLTQTQMITSPNPGDVTTPVNDMTFSFENVDISNIISGGDVIITIALDNVDADDPTEVFEIIDENGIVIGTTPNTFNQCGDTSLVITTISTGIINFWALDGVINIMVVPLNSGTLAINDVCLNSSVTVTISYEIEVNSNIEFAYSLDQGPFIPSPFGEDILLNLDVGNYELVYRYIDCGSNELQCSQVINLRDGSPPEVFCPQDSMMFVENVETCQAAYFFDPDIMVNEDCGLAEDSLQFFVLGATEVPLTLLDGNLDFVILESGLNDVSIVATDASGNRDTCTFEVSVIDTLAPIASCQDINIQLLPNLETELEITSDDINLASSDFCGPVSFELDQSLIDCSFIDSTIIIQMTITDESGNSSICNSTVTVSSYVLEPTIELGFCEGDTLYFFSNLPDSLAGVSYEYLWTGPNFTSNAVNPTISNISSINNGIYNLVVTGPGGCKAEGEVVFDIEQQNVIEVSTDTDLYCIGQSILLSTQSIDDVDSYIWFGGPEGMEEAFDTTDVPNTELISVEDINSFYVQLDYGTCLSSISENVLIEIQEELLVSAALSDTTLCTGAEFSITVSDPLVSVDYEWFDGSNILVSTNDVLDFANVNFNDEGIYKLVGKSGVCESDTFFINITIVEGLETPQIDAENVFCTGSTISLVVNNEPNGSAYTWTLNGSFYETTLENSLIIPNATTAFSGLWQVSLVEGFCISEVSQNFEISVEEEILIGASNNGPGCEGDSITLIGSFLPGASYTWTAPDNEIYEGITVNVPSVEGEYVLLVETEAGCQNSTTTFVEVNEAVTVTALSNTSTQCMNLGDTIVFAASVFPPGDYQYQWTGPDFNSDEESAMIDSFSLENNGVYTLVVFNENCPSNEITTLVNAAVTPERPELLYVSGSCDGDNLQLASGIEIPGATYLWSTPSGQINGNDPSLSLPSSGVQIDGFYTLSIEVNGCESAMSDTLTIDFGEMPDDPQLITDTDICVGDDISMFVFEEAATYIWTGLIDTITTDGNLLLPNVQVGGIVSVQLQNQDCLNENISTVEISVNQVPSDIEFDFNDIPTCLDPNETYDLCINNYDPSLTYTIINDFGQELSVSTDDCISIQAENLNSGNNILYLFSNAGDCRSAISEPISISTYPENIQGAFIQEGNFTICDKSEQFLNAVMIPEGGTIAWSSPDETLDFNVSDDMAAVSNLSDGMNEVVLTTHVGACNQIFTDTIQIFAISNVDANDDIFSIPSNESRIYDVIENDEFDESVSITIIGQPVKGQAFVDNGKITFIPESGFFGEVTIIYEICSDLCSNFCSRANLIITVGDDEDCTVPTIFTPNNDSVNDVLVIECLSSDNYSGNRLLIFNQWGDEVYSAQPYTNDWQGTYANKPLPAGTYFYVLDLNDGSRPVNGFIVLER